MRISVVIPALNEADRIGATLEGVHAQPGFFEAIVVDGGSGDGTREAAASRARVLRTPPGRAPQMNAGARIAQGDVLLFLHADTLLPPEAFAAIHAALADSAVEAGCFRLAFDRPGLLLRLYGFCTRLPWHRIAFGDRALFVRRHAFQAVGGFPDLPLFEDLDLARLLHRRHPLAYLPLPVTTAARRFEANGFLRQQLRNTSLWLLYTFGAPPARLQRFYPYPAPAAE